MALTLSPADVVLRAAKLLLPVREAQANRGRFVDSIITRAGGKPPEPWCASFVYYVGRGMLQERWPLPKTRSCDVLLEFARNKGVLEEKPVTGGLFLVLKAPHDAVHVGFVSGMKPEIGPHAFRTIEGNANELGSREGTGVFENDRGGPADKRTYAFVDWEALL